MTARTNINVELIFFIVDCSMNTVNRELGMQEPTTAAAPMNCCTSASWSTVTARRGYLDEAPDETITTKTMENYSVEPQMYEYQIAYYLPTQNIPIISLQTTTS